ncbi:MAG TPA: type II secretion system F family protein [Thermoanaerobaculia bacterium]
MSGLTRLPAAAVNGLADLVAAGFGVAEALAALPRQSLSKKMAHRLDAELALLQSGGPLDAALDRLGLEITAASIRGSRERGAGLEKALRADGEAQAAIDGALKKTRRKIQLFALVLIGLSVSTFYLSFISVPAMIRKSTENLPADWEVPPALLQFESFRNLWLAVGASSLLMMVALVLTAAGCLGRERWSAFLQDLRLFLPFLRAHAVHASRARLLEALAFEQAAGLPANETLRRVSRREPVPRLAAALALGAARLDAGDPWASCLRGTLLDMPQLADLTALAGHGARPTKGLQWAAAQSREQAVTGLRWAVTALAGLLLIPLFVYLLVLMHVASVTAAIAQVESIRLEMEALTSEVEQILQKP